MISPPAFAATARNARRDKTPADVLVAHDIGRRALHEHLAFVDDVSAVDDVERFADIVIGDQHADAAILQMAHKLANVVDRDGINSGERLVQKDVGGGAWPERARSRPAAARRPKA